MNFIQGQALLRSKCNSFPSISYIFKMEIVNYFEMILEGDHILTDDLGQIIIFDCKKGKKKFKGIIKYWSSKEKEYLDFELKPKEDKDVNYILINGIYYFISSKPSLKPIISIYYKKGRFYAKNDDDKDFKEGGNENPFKLVNENPPKLDNVNPPKLVNDTPKINTLSFINNHTSSHHSSIHNTPFNHSPLEVIIPCSSPLLDIITLNIPSSCSLHSSLSYFCFSDFKTYFGFIFTYFLEGYHYYSILLLSKFYNTINLYINLNINLNILLFPNNCFMITNFNKELYLSNFINLNFNFPLNFLDKVIGSILNEEKICFISKKDLLLKIMYFLKYIEPFKWSHSLIISKSKDLNIIESPLPFIYGICEGDDVKDMEVVDVQDMSNEDMGEGMGKDTGNKKGINKKAVSNPPSLDLTLNNPPSINPPSLLNNYILIDLDSFTINPPIPHNPPNLPYNPQFNTITFPLDFTLRLSHFLDLKKKLILNLNPDLIQDFLLYSHKYFLNDKFLIYPEDDYFSFFLKRFTSTRMFIRYLVEERFTPINYIYDIHFKKIEIIPFKNLLDYKIEEVVKGFIKIYDIKNKEMSKKIYDDFENGGVNGGRGGNGVDCGNEGEGDYGNGIDYKNGGDCDYEGDYENRIDNKEDINYINDNIYRASLLRRLSIQKDFKLISNLIKRKPLTLKESQMINIYEEQRNFKIKEKDYEGMYFVNICDYKDEGCEIKGLDWIKDKIKDNNSKDIINLHSPLNHNKDNCKFKTLIFKNEMVFNLYPLSSLITVFLNLPKNEDLKEYPEIFYNLVGYFYYFDLPFNTEEVDYVI